MGYYHICEEGLMLGTFMPIVLFILENDKVWRFQILIDFSLQLW